ncbi:hypothetical protein ABZ512_13490 [Nocardiopsis dassonvillei]|uniref:hypothetical protein n=1 Tax=Nocardiopsis dassonvillei TaxID=2014 RepID=UPI0033C3CE20
MRRRTENVIFTLAPRGRSVGFAVLTSSQNPRNLFPDKATLRLDEASGVNTALEESAGNAALGRT